MRITYFMLKEHERRATSSANKEGDEMLILTRCVGEGLIIDDNIEVRVLGVKGNQIRIGVSAPQNIDVHREEIYQRIQSQKKASKEGNAHA